MNRDTRLLHVLLHMDQPNERLTSDVLARSMGTNPAVFRRTMAGLREAGLVRSEKGHGGGWQLARPLCEITLLDVYDALGRPNLFAVGNRSEHAECLVEKERQRRDGGNDGRGRDPVRHPLWRDHARPDCATPSGAGERAFPQMTPEAAPRQAVSNSWCPA